VHRLELRDLRAEQTEAVDRDMDAFDLARLCWREFVGETGQGRCTLELVASGVRLCLGSQRAVESDGIQPAQTWFDDAQRNDGRDRGDSDPGRDALDARTSRCGGHRAPRRDASDRASLVKAHVRRHTWRPRHDVNAPEFDRFRPRPRVISHRLSLVWISIGLCGCSVLSPVSDPRPVVRGPVAVKTNGPIVQNLLQFRPRSTQTTATGKVDVELASAYSSIFVNGNDSHSQVTLDGEIWRNTLRFRTGLTPTIDIEAELAYVTAMSGFLDGFIQSWHAFLGLPNGGREKRGENEYEMHADKDGQRVYSIDENTVSFGDLPIVLTGRIVDESEGTPAIVWRAGVELPTGSESSGYGNGGLDWGGGVALERSLGRVTLTGGAYYVFVANPDSFSDADVSALDQIYAHLGAELRWSDTGSLVTGLRFSRPATTDIAIPEIDGNVLDLDVGWAEDIGESVLTFGLTEDLIAESGPDFTVFASWSCSF